jgi:hypothetical protein
MLSFQGASTTTGMSSVTLFCTRHFHSSINFRNILLLLYLTHKTFKSRDSKLAHQQGSKAFNHQVPMPPSRQPAKLHLRGKPPKAPRLSQSGREQHRPLRLIRRSRFKQTRPMHLSRPSIHSIKARHRLSLLSKQSPLPLKVKYQSQNHR